MNAYLTHLNSGCVVLVLPYIILVTITLYPAGTYIGASSTDYGRLAQQLRTQSAPTAYDATAATLSVASGRLSYTFGLRGPAMTVDTVRGST
jgi:acyl transferase domain-containing protein